ncbi:MAG: hypothetical protein AUK34_11120 [Ignavibacteria bacterium CG2_30_36_16]|nr:MAG: hypothetical protein AUK34_11120 [Ignavibacteria bacterium CG2_30_36_16]PJA99564.1 MAG: hypothetical protein CO127_10225 [Ignavibacteria bacterium CG_4_9_14_3_um_filter_36_18]
MKKILLSLMILTSSIFVLAQENQDAMKAWMEYMTPGDMHKMMAESEGEWTTKISFWQAPGTEAMVSEGTVVNEMMFGGRYLKATHKFASMGMPMEGVSLQAYDNGKKEFINIWFDNMGTGFMIATGKYDDATKSIQFSGKTYDPLTKSDMEIRENYKIIDADNHLMEMFMVMGGQEFKQMEIEFKRK